MQCPANPQWNPGVPAWNDAGREIQFLMPGGEIITGTLRVHRYLEDALGNKIPLLVLQDLNGKTHPFSDADQWRFLSDRSH